MKMMALITEEDGSAGAEIAVFFLLALAAGVGLICFSANNILARAFYAFNDTRTPMWISLYCLSFNLVLVFFLAIPLQQRGLALANTLSAVGNTALLLYALKKALPKFALREFGPVLLSVGAIAAAVNGQVQAAAAAQTAGLVCASDAVSLKAGAAPQQAIDLPNFGSLNGPTLLEEKRFPPAFVEALRAAGHEVKEVGMTSGVQAIRKDHGSYVGGADPRREGRVMGE